jgi:hypothetical protein
MLFAGRPADLWDPRVVAGEADHGPVSGAMALYVGSQYSAEESWGYYRIHGDVHPKEEPLLRPLAARIRAFDIPALRGVTWTVSRLRDVAPTQQAMLAERLPEIP